MTNISGKGEVSEKPILHTIRQILKFKDTTTIAEIASIVNLPRKKVLEVLNQNGSYVYRDRKNGKIHKVNPRAALKEKLWKEGAYYIIMLHDYGSVKGLEFNNKDLKEQLLKEAWGGFIGDSYKYQYVPDNPKNRKILENNGLVEESKIIIDDRLWVE